MLPGSEVGEWREAERGSTGTLSFSGVETWAQQEAEAWRGGHASSAGAALQGPAAWPPPAWGQKLRVSGRVGAKQS